MVELLNNLQTQKKEHIWQEKTDGYFVMLNLYDMLKFTWYWRNIQVEMSNKQLDMSLAEEEHLGINSKKMAIAGISINKITPKESVQSRKTRGLRKNPGEQWP